MAHYLESDHLVAAGDHFVLDPKRFDPVDPRPYATIDELAAGLSGYRGRGATKARTALTLVRPGAESRMETLLRLLLLRARLPEPDLNLDVFDADHKCLGRADLVWPEFMTIAEYDGDQHRTSRSQYDRDITRTENFVNAGWSDISVRARAFFNEPANVIYRVAEALRRGGWTP